MIYGIKDVITITLYDTNGNVKLISHKKDELNNKKEVDSIKTKSIPYKSNYINNTTLLSSSFVTTIL